MKNLKMAYLRNDEKIITDGEIWIVCHPEDGEIVASSADENTAYEIFSEDEIICALNEVIDFDISIASPGTRGSINLVWKSE